MGRSLNIFFAFAPREKLRGAWRGLHIILRKIGPTFRASPVRRAIQVTSLGLFLWLFFYTAWPYSADFRPTLLEERQPVPAELFLWIDPLVGLSTAIAARQWNVAVWGALAILLVSLFFTRGFCGYLCPLGTSIDAVDWLLRRLVPGRRSRKISLPLRGGAAPDPPAAHVHIKYYLLGAILISSAFGVLISGYFAAIPVLTRGLLFTGGHWQIGFMRGWSQPGPFTLAMGVSVAMFTGVFLLGLIGPRFWCRYVCPSGAVFSIGNLLRIGQRHVDSSCISCNRCLEICPFDAIKPQDFTTRSMDCTFCQSCGGVCPTGSINFASRWNRNPANLPGSTAGPLAAGNQTPLSRRALLGSMFAGAAAAIATRPGFRSTQAMPRKLIRPPGSVAEDAFLDLCIRCGECFKVCPGPVLQPAGLEAGLEALWTPKAVFSHAACHQDCNFCTQVCPTGAIVPLTIEQKRKTAMGLAIVDTAICLPHAGTRECRLCFDECEAAGYHAIQMRPVRLEIGDLPQGAFSADQIEEMSTILAPFVLADACTGCGLCEYRCHAALVKQQKLIPTTAIVVVPETTSPDQP
jgi:ferredoxin